MRPTASLTSEIAPGRSPEFRRMPATSPINTPCHGSTKPDAGVMVPSPATAPDIIPSTEGLPRVHHSMNIQVIAPVEAARWVAVMA